LCLLAAGCGSTVALDLDGRELDPLAGGAPATALFFVSATCPISNRYAPELGRLYQRFVPRAALWLVYLREDAVEIRGHARAFGAPLPALRDVRRALVRAGRAEVTPEAAVFRGRALVYHGRIDDRFVDFGSERPAPTRHDAADALDAVLDGKPVAEPSAPAVGCAIEP
jgi:hypothetical protein